MQVVSGAGDTDGRHVGALPQQFTDLRGREEARPGQDEQGGAGDPSPLAGEGAPGRFSQ